jgi:FAD:protein FMN transferase
MGTSYHVTVTGAHSEQAQDDVRAVIDAVLLETERHLSSYDEASEISLLNRDGSSQWQDISAPLFRVLQEARQVSELTGGAFDATVGPLLELWGGANQPDDAAAPAAFVPPTGQEITEAKRSVGSQNFELRGTPRPAVRMTAGDVRLSVDGIAPGYAVDRIAEELKALGFGAFIVEIGGEVRARGERPDGGPWRIAIEVPRATGREPLVGILLRDAAVSTSGDYRDERVDTAGRRYSRTIDPRTGHPVQGALTSVTVIADSAMRADAFATALMVMGTEAGRAWATELRVPALFVERTQKPGEWRLVESPAFSEWRE